MMCRNCRICFYVTLTLTFYVYDYVLSCGVFSSFSIHLGFASLMFAFIVTLVFDVYVHVYDYVYTYVILLVFF